METKTISVPHLSTTASYALSHSPPHPSKPTLVLINSFTTSAHLYRDAFANPLLAENMNLLAIELLGHGQTKCASENWTYWDTAVMNLQVMEKLGVERAFVLGTSQGGWVAVRMGLLDPGRVSIFYVVLDT